VGINLFIQIFFIESKKLNGRKKNAPNNFRHLFSPDIYINMYMHWTRSLFPQLTTTNSLYVYWWNRWNRQIWIFPSIPNTDTMYINSGAIYVHSATDVLTVRGNKQLYLRGGIASGVRGLTILHNSIVHVHWISVRNCDMQLKT